jgi:dephospho-CoA kinase
MQQQTGSAYVIKESALFFESGSFQDIDFMIGVAAPESLRIERILQRDNLSEAAIKARIEKQMNEAEKMSRCDAVILNDGTSSLIEQVVALHQQLLDLATTKK